MMMIIIIMLIDVAIHGCRNVIKRETEKTLKYKRPHNRNSAHVECETKVIPVVTGATGTISKPLRQYLINVPEKHEIKELQKRQPYWALHTHCGKC